MTFVEAVDVKTDAELLRVALADGRKLAVPLDEDISVVGLLRVN